MNNIKHCFNVIIGIATIIMVVLITILNWGIIFFTIADYMILHISNSKEIYEILGCIWLILAIPSHVFCQIIMYDDRIYTLGLKWINNNSTKWFVMFSLYYIDTYFLDWYFIKKKYSRDFVTYNTSSTESFWIIFPILNLIVYYKMINYCRRHMNLKENNRFLLKLFFNGQLMTYMIKNY